MTRDIIALNDFIVLIEHSTAEETIIDKCGFEDEVIGIAFYGSGNVLLSINHGDEKRVFNNTKGFVMSFFINDKVEFVHTISPEKPLESIVVVCSLANLKKLPNPEWEVFNEQLKDLVNPQSDYVEGPNLYMTSEMQVAVDKIFKTTYKGKTRMMFLRSQVTELLAHFFALLAEGPAESVVVKEQEREQLYRAKAILTNNMVAPPSLNELSKLIGLNSYKLKKNFKALFGMPVFKYLQQERLTKAHELLRSKDLTIQEVAWDVGYDSLSSFSNAFAKQFGYRPSEIKR